MRVAAFDMGIKNFAFAQVEIDSGYVCWVDVHDFRDEGRNIHRALIVHLDRYQHLWQKTDVVLIEQQLNRHNIQASRLACHVAAYFFHRFPSMVVHDYPNVYKTRYLHAPRTLDHAGRKKFAVEAVLTRYQGIDPVLHDWLLSGFSKLDDVADCILMALTFSSSPLSF